MPKITKMIEHSGVCFSFLCCMFVPVLKLVLEVSFLRIVKVVGLYY